MSQMLSEAALDVREIAQYLVTEDDEPVDNIFSEKQQRLLVEPLYSFWQPPKIDETSNEQRKFLAGSNVGIFYSVHESPVVPDMFLSLDVEVHENWYAKEHRSYFVWEFGEVPDVAIEIVSNRKGGELDLKLQRYARIDVTYYAVFDPLRQLSDNTLRVYERGFGKRYRLRNDYSLPDVGLNLVLWQGLYETKNAEWLRWSDVRGNLISTGAEQSKVEAQRAKHEAQRADVQTRRAETEAQRAEAEMQRAETEAQRAEQETLRAESEAQRRREAEARLQTEAEARRQAENELERLRAELQRLQK